MLSGWEADYSNDQYVRDQRIAQITYKAACRISNYECVRPAPVVRRSPILGENGIRGAYWVDSTVVWLDRPLKGSQLWLTIFHEQVHYLQTQNTVGGEGYDKLLTCLVEREALDFTNEYAVELDRSDLIRTIEVWRELYNCKPQSQTGMHH
jgi:hypothetical protein